MGPQAKFIEAFDNGSVLSKAHNFVTFRCLGLIWISNPKRQKRYHFDNPYWRISRRSWFWKIIQILQKKVKLAH
jgi:hypothetical protein